MKRTQQVASASVDKLALLPSVDKVLISAQGRAWVEHYGRDETLRVVRGQLDQVRTQLLEGNETAFVSDLALTQSVEQTLCARAKPNLRSVINLTGTVLHTNLGRAVMPPEAIAAMSRAAAEPSALEYDLGQGKRGDRDELVEDILCELTGAEAVTVVNNNAAAVFLLLHALSAKKETIVSRGELIEIGGAFRIPDIMKRAGAHLIEVGTTNRTHAKDFKEAIHTKTGLVMKVHTSNYVVHGFTAEVAETQLASIAHEHGIPFVVDLGSGTLVDLSRYGLPLEPTPQQALANGADLVTFSCDKLLGGPQAGIIAGRKDLIQKIKKNPLKRVLRVGKITLAGLEAVLKLYRDPDRLPQRLTVLQLLMRPASSMQQQSERLISALIDVVRMHGLLLQGIAVRSQIGSGSLPVERLDSVALMFEGHDKIGVSRVVKLEKLLRSCDTPVIGRMQDKKLVLDLRCLPADKEALVVQAVVSSLSLL